MKRLSLILTAAVAFAVTACQSETKPPETVPVEKVIYETVTLKPENQVTLEALVAKAKSIEAGKDPAGYLAAYKTALEYAEPLYPSPHPAVERIKAEVAYGMFMTGGFADALKMVEDSVPIFKAGGAEYSKDYIDAMTNVGSVYGMMGRNEEGIVVLKQVVAARKSLPDGAPLDLSISINNLAMNTNNLGRHQDALELNAEALGLLESITPQTDPVKDQIVVTLGNKSLFEATSGDRDKAIKTAEDLLGRLDALIGSNAVRSSSVMATTAILMLDAGRLNEAEALARKGLNLRAEALGPKNPLTATMRNTLCSILMKQGKYDEVIEQSRFARDVLRENSGPYAHETIIAEERILNANFKKNPTRENAQKQADLITELQANLPPNHPDVIANQQSYALMVTSLKEYDTAVKAFKDLLDVRLASKSPDSAEVLQARAMYGYTSVLNGNPELGFAFLDEALDVGEASRLKRLAESGSQALGDEVLTQSYGRALTAALAQDDQNRFLRYFRGFNDSFLDRARQQAELRLALPEDAAKALKVRQDKTELRARKRADLRLASASDQSETTETLRQDIEQLDAELSQFPAGIDFDWKNRDDLTVASLQQELTPKSALLIVVQAELEMMTLLVTSDDAVLFANVAADTPAWSDANAIRSQVAGLSEFDPAPMENLYSQIFTPTALTALKGRDHLLVMAKGPLANIPLSLLKNPETGRYLVEDFATSYPASLKDIGKSRNSKSSGKKTFFGIGAPEFIGPATSEKVASVITTTGGAQVIALRSAENVETLRALPNLDYAKAELKALRTAIDFKKADVVTGRKATQASLSGVDLSKTDIIAFATHGLMPGELAGVNEPALVLSLPEGESISLANDGLLTAAEISQLNLKADLVILSACNTASGGRVSEEPFSGLAQAFVFAGADKLLVSHWPIRDDVAARLTVATVKGANESGDYARALQAATLSVMNDVSIQDGKNPRVWAPLVLVQ